MKYILLNPADVFAEITSQARSVILAGGTMSPLCDFKAQILPNEDIVHFSCGHIVPASSIKNMIVTGNKNVKFDFSFDKRGKDVVLRGLLDALVGFAKVIPGGIHF
jgi:chromosome transmission fidelity protein 1